MNHRLRLLALPALLATASLFTTAAPPEPGRYDWPQWRGPDRTGVSQEKGLLPKWPKDGPKLLWKSTDVLKGYSTPSEADGRLYVLGNDDKDEFAIALDTKDGKKLWSVRVGKVGENKGPQYPGTRSTPTVVGDVLYALGSAGDLVCLETKGGKVRWRKNLKKDFGGEPGFWAYSESPLVDGDKVICTPGGKEATLVALNRKDGSVVWKAKVPGGDAAAYASAIVAQVGKVRTYVQFLHKGLVSVDAATGKFLWRYDKTADPAANIPTPVYHDGLLFNAAARSKGALLQLTVSEDGGVRAKPVWTNPSLQLSIGGVVLVDGYLYGTTAKGLFCADFKTGKVKWQNRCVGPAGVCYADGCLYLRGDGGTFNVGPSWIALVKATPEGYEEKGRFKQPDRGNKQAWQYPVVANGRFYVRDQNLLLCYDVKAK